MRSGECFSSGARAGGQRANAVAEEEGGGGGRAGGGRASFLVLAVEAPPKSLGRAIRTRARGKQARAQG